MKDEYKLPPKTPQKWAILASSLLIIIFFLMYFFLKIGKNFNLANERNAKPSVTQKRELPKKNIILFTRCYGGERQYHYCNLYASNLKEPEEILVYTFDYPYVEQTNYEIGFNLELIGVVNKKVVYIKTYWEKEDQGTQNFKILGILDIDSLENNILFKQTSGQNSGYFYETYLDVLNGKLYYITSNNVSQDKQIIQYDLNTKISKTITDSNKLGGYYVPLAVSADNVFLSPREETPYNKPAWVKTFHLDTGSVEEMTKIRSLPIFSPQVDHVAWVEEEKVGTNSTLLRLKVSKIDGSDEKEIYVLKSKNSTEGNFLSNFSHYHFNTYGDRLSFKISQSDSYAQTPIEKQYISFLEGRKITGQNQKGIVILPPENPYIYKNLMEVYPGNQDYQWVQFLTLAGPLEGNIEEGIIFEEENAWYLKSDVNLTWYKGNKKSTSLVGEKHAITVSAKNLFLLPHW